jgi:alkylation response protein AidB-like acyl-CoA dehydrogenase
MDFTLNEEQEMLKKSARDFLKKQCDKTVVKELEESETGFNKKLWKNMAKLDWMAIIIPEDYEGVGWSFLDLAVLFEEFGRSAFNGPMMCNTMGTLAVMEGGTDDQKSKILPKVASGKMVLTMANDETSIAYDHSYIEVAAKKTDSGYVINGTKILVPYATVADKMLVSTRTSGAPGDKEGITIFMVDPKSQGITLTPLKVIGGEKQFIADFDNVAVSADDVIGGVDKGLSIVESVIEKITAVQCAEMVGGAECGLNMTSDYTRERVQFKRAIATFQSVQHRMSDMFVFVQCARWTTYQALWRLSEGMSAKREIAIAKIITNDAVREVAFSAQQLHGGMGVDLDYDLHWYYTRAKNFELKYGTTPAQNELLQAQIGL